MPWNQRLTGREKLRSHGSLGPADKFRFVMNFACAKCHANQAAPEHGTSFTPIRCQKSLFPILGARGWVSFSLYLVLFFGNWILLFLLAAQELKTIFGSYRSGLSWFGFRGSVGLAPGVTSIVCLSWCKIARDIWQHGVYAALHRSLRSGSLGPRLIPSGFRCNKIWGGSKFVAQDQASDTVALRATVVYTNR